MKKYSFLRSTSPTPFKNEIPVSPTGALKYCLFFGVIPQRGVSPYLCLSRCLEKQKKREQIKTIFCGSKFCLKDKNRKCLFSIYTLKKQIKKREKCLFLYALKKKVKNWAKKRLPHFSHKERN